ncbi:odorant receptor 4-like [Ostrinia nubilalis]|uniref:odorant receptor 4-like n=1 Tax=Ostrinia nubilalis TaxID=29057 RepID=UPI0030822C28
MTILNSIWRKLTNTKALEKSSGCLETQFFETVYRVSYLTGISMADEDIPYLIYSSVVKLLIFLLIVGEFWHLATEVTSFDEMADMVNITVIQYIAIFRYRSMLYHKDVYKKLATSMESQYFDISTKERRDVVDYWVKRNANNVKLLLVLGNCTLIAWFLYPLVDDLEYNVFIGIRLPFPYYSPVCYAFVYLLLLIVFSYISHFVMANDLIMQAHLLHMVCQFDVLCNCFENLMEDCAKGFKGIDRESLLANANYREVFKARLGDMITQHRYILDHAMELRHTLSGPMLGQLAASGTLICFIGYQATTSGAYNITKCLMSLFYLCYNLLVFYIICRWCEEISVQSQRVGEAVYCSNWECGASNIPGVKVSLLMVITRANKPLTLTAGGVYDLSLMTFSSILKTSYSALTLLLRLKSTE